MTAALTRLAALVNEASGIWIKPDQLGTLQAALLRINPNLAADELLIGSLTPHSPAIRQLVEELTVQETFFFRQDVSLRALDWRKIVERARQRGDERARVWVAACATGEEAYTLAILASEAFYPSRAPVEIVGTDISRTAIDRARIGVYGRRSLRSLDDPSRDRYFTRHGNGTAVCEGLRGMVSFEAHNLVDEQPPSASRPHGFDVITCRNVLIYFDEPTVERVVALLERSLAPGGELHLGAADRLCVSAQTLRRLDAQGPGEPVPERPPRYLRVVPHRRPRSDMAGRRQRSRDAARSVAITDTLAASAEQRLREAVAAANKGELELAAALTARMLAENPLDADAYFVRGLAELGLGQPAAAAGSFRAALYVDSGFGLAAFQMARAHDACGDTAAAATAYRRALNILMSPSDPTHQKGGHLPEDTATSRHALLYAEVDDADIASACSIRLQALAVPERPDPDRGRA